MYIKKFLLEQLFTIYTYYNNRYLDMLCRLCVETKILNIFELNDFIIWSSLALSVFFFRITLCILKSWKLVIQRIRQIWVTCTVLFMIGRKTKGHVWIRPSFWPEFRPLLSISLYLSLSLFISLSIDRLWTFAHAPDIKTFGSST